MLFMYYRISVPILSPDGAPRAHLLPLNRCLWSPAPSFCGAASPPQPHLPLSHGSLLVLATLVRSTSTPDTMYTSFFSRSQFLCFDCVITSVPNGLQSHGLWQVGFDMIDAFAQSQGIQMSSIHCKALFGEGWISVFFRRILSDWKSMIFFNFLIHYRVIIF